MIMINIVAPPADPAITGVDNSLAKLVSLDDPTYLNELKSLQHAFK